MFDYELYKKFRNPRFMDILEPKMYSINRDAFILDKSSSTDIFHERSQLFFVNIFFQKICRSIYHLESESLEF